MGKSSFIQALLSLRQSSRINLGELRLNGELLDIGTTKDALYQYCKGDDCLSFAIEFTNSEKVEMSFDYAIDSDVFTSRKKELPSVEIFKNSFFGSQFQYLKADRESPSTRQPKNHSSVVTNRSVGSTGLFTAHFIEVYGSDDITFDNLIHKNSIIRDGVTGAEIINKTLLNQINLWMGEISPGVSIRTTSIPSDEVLLEYTFAQKNFGTTNKFKPSNVGFGITYALPVVTTLLAAKPGDLIIIENPESHIHPRGQAELGKLISLVAMNDVQIIVETHSDHLLNGVRVATKEKCAFKNSVIAFYFEKIMAESEQYSKITNIEIDENGELSAYPLHLLDEWSNQLVKLV